MWGGGLIWVARGRLGGDRRWFYFCCGGGAGGLDLGKEGKRVQVGIWAIGGVGIVAAAGGGR